MRRLTNEQYRLRACLQSTGTFNVQEYPENFIKEVHLISENYLSDFEGFPIRDENKQIIGKALFAMTNKANGTSIWSGDFIK